MQQEFKQKYFTNNFYWVNKDNYKRLQEIALEVSNAETITKEQTEVIKKHLNLVFKHEIDPSMGDEKHQQELNAIHSGTKPNKTNPVLRC